MPVTNREAELKDTSSIVSKTDVKGTITYINRDFMEISGFSEQELIGHNHNIVRHPDMPPAAFEDLWNTIKAGKPWSGIVKNRCKNGDHYWVEANVAPIREGNQVVGYLSVRAKPTRQQIEAVEPLYRQMLQGTLPKVNVVSRFVRRVAPAFKNMSLYGKVLMAITLPVAAVVGFALVVNPQTANGLALAGVGAVAALIASVLLARAIILPIQRVTSMLNTMANGDLQVKIDTSADDEIGKMVQALKSMQIRLGFDVNDARKMAEEALRLQVALDVNSTGFTFSDSQNMLQYMNQSAMDLWQNMSAALQKQHADFSVKTMKGKSIGQYLERESDRTVFAERLKTPRSMQVLCMAVIWIWWSSRFITLKVNI